MKSFKLYLSFSVALSRIVKSVDNNIPTVGETSNYGVFSLWMQKNILN